jgi:uncharacterized membrane protein YedE/YeeE
MSPIQKTSAQFSRRRLGLAGLAAILGCAICCALPLLAAAGLGSGVAAGLGRIFRPGSELIVGGIVFVVALAVMTIRHRLRRHACRAQTPHTYATK